MKLASDYVMAVAKEVQRHADVEAIGDAALIDPSLADRPPKLRRPTRLTRPLRSRMSKPGPPSIPTHPPWFS